MVRSDSDTLDGFNLERKFESIHKDSYGKLLEVLQARLPVSVQLYNSIKLALTGENDFEAFTYKGQLVDHSIIAGRATMQKMETEPGLPFVFLSVPPLGSLTPDQAKDFVTHFSDPTTPNVGFVVEQSLNPLISSALLNEGHRLSRQACEIAIIDPENRHSNPTLNTQTELYVVKDLRLEDAKHVGLNWSYDGWNDPAHYIRKCIEQYPSAGAYCAQTKELRSWAILYNFGSIGMLFTPEKHRGKGLAKLVIEHLIQGMLGRDLIPAVAFEPNNAASKGVMLKLGFQVAFTINILLTGEPIHES